MVRFSREALVSLAVLCAASSVASAASTARTTRRAKHRLPPVGSHTVEISPTSSILLNQIRDALLRDDDDTAKLRRGDGRDRDRRLLLDRSLKEALIHPNSPLDESLLGHLPPSHPARKLLTDHNAHVEEFQSTRHLSRFETKLRRDLGLFPFGDLDAESALDGDKDGYGPLGHLGLVGNGDSSSGGDSRRRLDPPLPPPNQPPGQPGQPGQPPQPGQPGSVPEPGLQQQQQQAPPVPGTPPPPDQPEGQPGAPVNPEPGQPGVPSDPGPPVPEGQGQPGQPGDPNQPAGQPGDPNQPGGLPGAPGDPGDPNQPGGQQQPGEPGDGPPPPPNVFPPAPPEAGGQPGLEAPVVPPGGPEGAPGTPEQASAPELPQDVPPGEPQPGGPPVDVVGQPILNQTQMLPPPPPPDQPLVEQPAAPGQPGEAPVDPAQQTQQNPPPPPEQQQPGAPSGAEEGAPAPSSPVEGGPADPALYAGLGPVVLNQTQTLTTSAPGGEPGQPEQPEQPGQPGQPEVPGGDVAVAVAEETPVVSTEVPTSDPSSSPTSGPTSSPSSGPTSSPTSGPSSAPTGAPETGAAAAIPPPPGEPNQPQPNQPGQPNEPTLPSETPPDVVLPKDAPPDAALPPGHDSGEILSGGLLNSYQTVPLLQGYGTHYSTVWVGSPDPQRVSVIVDTGSHFTAFPCKGCAGCGEEHHTDNYFNPEISETFKPLGCSECSDGARCSAGKCTFGQSYTEGSSWRAYQARDQFFCGGAEPSAARDPVDLSYAIQFMFGCQTSETGLFVGQLADGIMGMAAHRATLVKNMYDKKKLQHLMFAMCFRRELEASKLGVTAGVLTLGGVDARLERTPMLYARNKVKDGWFTVYVKKMYLRPGGGQSAARGGGLGGAYGDAHAEGGNDPGNVPTEKKPPVKIDMNPGSVNSGKGVIVDSGTTDTYFHRSLGVTFNRQWKALTGRDHNNKAMKLTREQLMGLPTLLVQLEAYDDAGNGGAPGSLGPDGTPAEQGEEAGAASEMVPGTAAAVDPASPNDVLLAIPATHYMEYSAKDDTYTSRLYFTESSGGVLGANAMMGHDVLFDWENGRVGFSESNCDYKDVVSVNEEAAPEDEVLGGNDCRLGIPALSVGCIDTVNLGPCDGGDENMVLVGTEKWTMVVESPGTPAGKSCEEVMLRDVIPGEEPPTVSCDGNGLCISIRKCEMTCSNAKIIGVSGGGDGGTPFVPMPVDDDEALAFESGSGAEDQRCGNDLWGACEYSCNQTRVTSSLMSDGECHETSVQTRPCHVDACGRSDPCRVPFVVHAILGFRGANAPLFAGRYRERFVEAFASTVNMNRVGKDELFGPGDVKVLAANHWYENEGEESSSSGGGQTPIGMKLIVEISIFNPSAKLPEAVVYEPLAEESPEDVEGNVTDTASSANNAKQTLTAMITAVRNAWNNLGGPPKTTCDESDIYPLSRTALHVHMEFERATFMRELIIVLMEYGDTGKGGASGSGDSASWSDPFSPMYKTQSYQDGSEFLSSWTIKTEIGGGTFHDHSGDVSVERGFNKDYVLYYITTNAQVLIAAVAALACVCCAGCCCGRSCARRSYERHAAALMEKLAARADEKRRGKYAQVGTGAGDMDDSDKEEEHGASFSGVTYRDNPVGDEEGPVEANGDHDESSDSDSDSDK